MNALKHLRKIVQHNREMVAQTWESTTFLQRTKTYYAIERHAGSRLPAQLASKRNMQPVPVCSVAHRAALNAGSLASFRSLRIGILKG
jgi:hypothetical protein